MNAAEPILIIGQGLAGSLLAWRLLERGQPVRVVDDGDRDGASRVAAGLVNPVTGRRLSLAPHTGDLLRQALHDYRRLQALLRQRLYRPLPMLRLLADSDQAGRLEQRRADPAYAAFLGPAWRDGGRSLDLVAPHGAVAVRHCGQLLTTRLLDGLRRWLAARGVLIAARFDVGDLALDPNALRWRGERFARAVFCEGAAGRDNPWFAGLPFQPCQGEILTLRTRRVLPRRILNDGRWLLPLDAHHCRVGAATQWQPLDRRCTETGRAALLDWCRSRFRRDPGFELLDQRCGIRPALRGAVPAVGLHPVEPRLAVFNGLGARGSLWAPWCSRRLAELLIDGQPVPAAIDPARFALAGRVS